MVVRSPSSPPRDEDRSSSCSSPEQDTVTRRPAAASRGPHVQHVFNVAEAMANAAQMTAVLPDGQVMTAVLPNVEKKEDDERE